jgi:Clathrin adaptor complex small chain
VAGQSGGVAVVRRREQQSGMDDGSYLDYTVELQSAAPAFVNSRHSLCLATFNLFELPALFPEQSWLVVSTHFVLPLQLLMFRTQVVLAASICTRGGKAVLSRQFREIARSRIEALLASFPKLADSGTQHTTVEQDNVRFVYQPLDELYIVLITNRQSNILQDIDSLHLFAQVTTSICKTLDEREITRNAFELLSAFDELVTLGYRENLSLSQIKTFLEMESHEERIQEIIERVWNHTHISTEEPC